MSNQPEALRLADDLIYVSKYSDSEHWNTLAETAAELRRLHASCEDYAQHKQRQDQRVLELAERALELKAQRDALLEALKGLVAWSDDLRREYPVEDLRKARSAIKAVEENT